LQLKQTIKRALAVCAYSALRTYARYSPVHWGRLRAWALGRDYVNFYNFRRVVRTKEGVRFECASEDLIQSCIMYFGMWDPHIERYLRARLRPGDLLVDVGANIGYFTLLGSRLVGPTGQVVAIEASPNTHEMLLANARRNGATNVRAVNAAASNHRGTVEVFAGSSDNIGRKSIMARHGAREATVEAFPLADILSADEIRRAAVIKIDVEGAEADVLRGILSSAHLLGDSTDIIVEMTPNWLADVGTSAEQLLDEFRALGYHAYELPSSSMSDYLSETNPPVRRRIDRALEAQTDVLLSRRADWV